MSDDIIQITDDVRVRTDDPHQYVVETRVCGVKGERWYPTAYVASVKSLSGIVRRSVVGIAVEKARAAAEIDFDARGLGIQLVTLPAKPKKAAEPRDQQGVRT